MNIDDIKLEINALQKLDTQNAINNGIEDKKEWFKLQVTSNADDVIAESLLDLSSRSEVNPEILASHFDDTMILRIAKQLQRQTLKQGKSI